MVRMIPWSDMNTRECMHVAASHMNWEHMLFTHVDPSQHAGDLLYVMI